MADAIGDDQSRLMLLLIFLFFGSSAAILSLFVAYFYTEYLHFPQKDFSINFGEDLTYTDESQSTWIVDNRGGNHEKLFSVYWNAKNSQGSTPLQTIKSSDLVDQSGKNLDSSNLKFNGSSVLTANFTHGWNKIYITLEDSSLKLGSFGGNLLLDGNTIDTIPITISTKPLVIYGIILVIIGALLSVCIWEVVRHFKNIILNNMPTNGPKGRHLAMAEIDFTIQLARVELSKQLIRNSKPSVVIPKLFLIELISAILGIVIALFGVLYNETVFSFLTLGLFEVVTLVGIGLATGSLKELVDKVDKPATA